MAPFAPERTISAFSFSKAYGMAGNRVGYLVGPEAVIAEAHKVSVHSAYHAPTAAQLAGLRALEGGAAWVANARAVYAKTGTAAAAALGLPAPAGGCFLFANAAHRLDARGLLGFLEDCFAEGVVVAPGSSAGEAYGSWIRLCFTVVPPDQALEAARRLARLLAADRS
jgi:N-succinyldiaminopimelate aminotransferase